jgi:hypothetical protein
MTFAMILMAPLTQNQLQAMQMAMMFHLLRNAAVRIHVSVCWQAAVGSRSANSCPLTHLFVPSC